MARIGISFKDNLEEDMYLYNMVLKNSCGSPSYHIKSVLRQMYKEQGIYKFDLETQRKNNDDDDIIIIK